MTSLVSSLLDLFRIIFCSNDMEKEKFQIECLFLSHKNIKCKFKLKIEIKKCLFMPRFEPHSWM